MRRDAQRNRERILEAARAGFAERGLGITLDEIARLAGVGVGTVYRRFPNKELLIDALFEDRVGEIAGLAEEALEDEDGWRGLTTFLTRVIQLQASDRGLRELVLGSQRASERVVRVRGRIRPLVEALVERAQAQGTLREDIRGTDFPLLLFMVDAVAATTHDVSPDAWRRALAIVLDGLRAGDKLAPLPSSALSDEQLDGAMRNWRP